MRSQRLKILEYLKTHQEGLNSYEATFSLGLGKQAPARIKELENMGYIIGRVPQGDRSVNWKLLVTPEQLNQLPNRSVKPEPKQEDWVFIGNVAYRREDVEPRQEALI